MRILLICLLAITACSPAKGQELTGIWRGKLTQGPGGCFPEYMIEMQLKLVGKEITGVSYHYSDLRNYVKEDFAGNFNAKANAISITEINVLTFHVPPDCVPCIKQYSLSYSKNGNREELSGEWGGKILNQNATCPPGRIVLTRVAESDFNHIKEIKMDTGTIRLDFYDNAEIDGDTISVLLNDKVIASQQRLSAKPITMEIRIDLANKEQEITMQADNLGSIPPNTALLIVTAAGKRYQLYLTSTEKKNAIVRFIYEKPPGRDNTGSQEK